MNLFLIPISEFHFPFALFCVLMMKFNDLYLSVEVKTISSIFRFIPYSYIELLLVTERHDCNELQLVYAKSSFRDHGVRVFPLLKRKGLTYNLSASKINFKISKFIFI